MLDVEMVELQNETATHLEALVLRAAVRALATQEPLVPPAAGLHIGYRDHRLRSHIGRKICVSASRLYQDRAQFAERRAAPRGPAKPTPHAFRRTTARKSPERGRPRVRVTLAGIRVKSSTAAVQLAD
jgi:hypothetical protein